MFTSLGLNWALTFVVDSLQIQLALRLYERNKRSGFGQHGVA